jgi:hypothetical protein
MKVFIIGMSALIVAFLIYLFMKTSKKSRGLALNNPFNIRISLNAWTGKKTFSKDKSFEEFTLMEFGIRAGLVNLDNAYFQKNLTLRQIVAKYAPASDNNNEKNYLDFLTKKTGVIPEQVPNREDRLKIAGAIMHYEQGNEVMDYVNLRAIAIRYNLLNYV